MASQLNDIGDVYRLMPGKLVVVFNFLKYYKFKSGKVNQFANYDKPFGKDFALTVVAQTHEEWRKKFMGQVKRSWM